MKKIVKIGIVINKQKVFSFVLIFMLFCSVAFSKTNDNESEPENDVKPTGLMFEISPVYNMFSFEDNPIGENNFYSTQIRARIGLSFAFGENMLNKMVVGVSYMDSKQFIKQNEFNFYVANLFFGYQGWFSKSSKFSLFFDCGIGFYNIEYNGYSKYSLYVSGSLGVGYNFSDNLILIAGYEMPYSAGDGDVNGPLISGKETVIGVWTFFLSFRYYFDLF